MTNQATNNSSSSTGGIGALGLIFAVLFVLKVAGLNGASWGLANLSWWWVFSPLLIGFGLFVLVMLVIAVIFVIAWLVDR